MINKLFKLSLVAVLATFAFTLISYGEALAKVKVGFILKTMQEERYQKDKAIFTEKAESLGAKVYFDSANNDEQMQLSKFENMLAKGCKVIVMQPVNTGTAGNMVARRRVLLGHARQGRRARHPGPDRADGRQGGVRRLHVRARARRHHEGRPGRRRQLPLRPHHEQQGAARDPAEVARVVGKEQR